VQQNLSLKTGKKNPSSSSSCSCFCFHPQASKQTQFSYHAFSIKPFSFLYKICAPQKKKKLQRIFKMHAEGKLTNKKPKKTKPNNSDGIQTQSKKHNPQ